MKRHDEGDSPQLIPPQSSFDFLEGAFAAAQRTRRMGLGITVAALAVLSGLSLAGLSGVLSARSSEAALERIQSENVVAVANLSKIDNSHGISADRLSAHVNERQRSLKDAVGSEIDVVALTRALRASAPAGVEISSIVFHDATDAVANAAPASSGSSSTTGSSEPAGAAAPSTPASAPAGGLDQIGSVEIKATMKNFTLLGAWGSSVRKISGLVPGDPTWQSSSGQVNASLTLPVTKDGLTQRANQISTAKGN